MMDLLSQLGLLVRGRASRAAAAVFDGHALDIASQAIAEGERALVQARHELASIVIQRRRFEAESRRLHEHLATRDRDGADAVARGQGDLARRIATAITAREAELGQVGRALSTLREQEGAVRDDIKSMMANLQRYRTEYHALSSMEAAQRAHGLARAHTADAVGGMAQIEAVLQRVRAMHGERHERARALAEIDAELSGQPLEEALRAAGINGRINAVDAVMARWQRPPQATE